MSAVQNDNAGIRYANHGFCQDLITPATQYAEKKGVIINDITNETYKNEYKGYGYSKDCINRGGGYWWLRSHGFFIEHACDVNYNGGAGETFFNLDVANVTVGVRPAMYLKK